MVQQRFSHSIDHLLQPHQYDFRVRRSLSTPRFSSDNSQKYLSSTPLYILFLDWSQAFDSIGHPHLAAALCRFGIPPLLVQARTAPYHNGQLFVTDPSICSPFIFPEESDKQGCPLSPNLFINVLSAPTSDLHSFLQEIFSYVPWTVSFSHPLTDVEYADDTVLIARTDDTLCRI